MLVKGFLFVVVANCCIATAAAAEENGEKPLFNEVNARCREEHNIQEEDAIRLNQTRHLETVDENLKCFVKCLLTGMKLMNEEGDLTLDDVEERKSKYSKHFRACKDVDIGGDPCEKALNFQNCLWKQMDLENQSFH